jgi:mannose-6-phosphate isomerase-like protein (cupin superfamily)
MIITGADATSIRTKVLREADTTGRPHSVDRYLIEGGESGGLVALVEHNLGPHVLAAPLHRHSREDEYSLVMEGRLGVFEDGTEMVAGPGELVFKPRGRWHTFWNASEERLRILELIAPAGIEELFRRLALPEGEYNPETLPALAAEYGCDVDFEATIPLIERHKLTF